MLQDSDDEFNFGEYESRDAADGRAAAKVRRTPTRL